MDNYYRTLFRAEQRAKWKTERELNAAERWVLVLLLIICILAVAWVIK